MPLLVHKNLAMTQEFQSKFIIEFYSFIFFNFQNNPNQNQNKKIDEIMIKKEGLLDEIIIKKDGFI